jgi:hypothetical protein
MRLLQSRLGYGRCGCADVAYVYGVCVCHRIARRHTTGKPRRGYSRRESKFSCVNMCVRCCLYVSSRGVRLGVYSFGGVSPVSCLGCCVTVCSVFCRHSFRKITHIRASLTAATAMRTCSGSWTASRGACSELNHCAH